MKSRNRQSESSSEGKTPRGKTTVAEKVKAAPLRSKDKYEAEIRRLKKQLAQANKQIRHMQETHISAEDIEQFIADQQGDLVFDFPIQDPIAGQRRPTAKPAPVERCKRCASAEVDTASVGIWKIVECRACGSRRRDQID